MIIQSLTSLGGNFLLYVVEDGSLRSEFFPIFQINAKVFYCTVLDSLEKDRASIVTLDLEYGDANGYLIARPVFSNLTTMMLALAEGCEDLTATIEDEETFETICRQVDANFENFAISTKPKRSLLLAPSLIGEAVLFGYPLFCTGRSWL